jgi:hypothetical protein
MPTKFNTGNFPAEAMVCLLPPTAWSDKNCSVVSRGKVSSCLAIRPAGIQRVVRTSYFK